MIRLITIMLFIYGLCLALVSGWHWSRAEKGISVYWIIFMGTAPDGYEDIFRVSIDGTELQNLSQAHENDNQFVVTPDGQWIIFLSQRDRNVEIYRMRLDGSDVQNLSQTPDINEYAPILSPDGKWIFYTHPQKNEMDNIYRMRLDGSDVQQLTYNLYDQVLDVTAQWVFFESYREANNREFYRIRWDGSEEQNLTQSTGRDSDLIISLDREWLFYITSHEVDYLDTIYRMRLDDLERQKIITEWNTGSTLNVVYISSDNQWILFNEILEGVSGGTIYRVQVDGSHLQQLTQSPEWDGAYGVTTDSKWILFESERDNDLEIYRMRLDGSEVQNLTQTFGEDYIEEITVDGQWILFNSERSGYREIYRMRLDGSGVKQLTNIGTGAYNARGVPLPNYPSHHEIGIGLGFALMVGTLFYQRLSAKLPKF